MTWKEGTKPVTEFAVDAECWGSTSTFIDAVIHLNTERRKRESCIILTNVLAEPISLRC